MSTSLSSHIAALRELGTDLPDAAIEKLALWLSLMDQAGRVMNLTGLNTPQAMAGELVGEALRLQAIAPFAPGAEVLDIGSGNGSPVVVLAVLNPDAFFTAVESRQRRADFLKFTAARMRLTNLEVVCQRVESLPPEHQGPYDVVVSRAFAAPGTFISIAAGLIDEAGEIRGMGGDIAGEVAGAATQAGRELVSLDSYRHGEQPRCVYLIR